MTKKKSQKEDNRYLSLDDPTLVFTTYDLGVSAALLCRDFELLTVQKDNPRKALFIFKRADLIEEVANSYFSNTLAVKARSFFDHLKALKNQLYSE